MPQNIRIVTATSLFDGHDAAINIMRRILQSKGVEVIHLGHNRSAHEIVECAIEEDATAIAITSYQGGHIEFFKYIKDLLDKNDAGHIKIFGGGGGTILPKEIEELHQYGITRIYSPDDGRKMGLEGMIEDVIMLCNEGRTHNRKIQENGNGKYPLGETHDIKHLARAITSAEEKSTIPDNFSSNITCNKSVIIGITGTGGAGKSSVTDEIVRRYLTAFADKTIAVISVDPSKRKTGGALLGDRIRMNAISHPRAYMRSLATRQDNSALSSVSKQAIALCKKEGYDCIILESAGVGQSDVSIVDHCDISIYVMTPEYGAASQLEKINMLDYADIIVINKFDKPGAEDALIDVRKQYKRNHQLFAAKDKDLPVLGVSASKFNDDGINRLFELLSEKIKEKLQTEWLAKSAVPGNKGAIKKNSIIPDNRIRYLSEISETIRNYNDWVNDQSAVATQLYQLKGSIDILDKTSEK
ncbi:MAG: cobalamin-dependent protein [Agriterribacter sp.]